MQTSMTTPASRHATIAEQQPLNRKNDEIYGPCIDPITLARLDFGLFKSLCKLGVSRERVCSALCISYEDFDYIRELATA
jgi:hypothetical protein